MTKDQSPAPFFPLDARMPVLLALILGLQHSLAMLAGVIVVPISIAGMANLDVETQQYLVSTSLIVSGVLSMIQIARFWVYGTRYYIGTGMLTVVGSSFAIITVAHGTLKQMYQNGYCPVDSRGKQLPCPEGYGAIVATCIVCALLEVCLSFIPSKALKKLFPPLVTGPVVLLIGVHLIGSGLQDWAGGSGDCSSHPATGMYSLCPHVGAPQAAPWGSAQFIGLGFLVFMVIILCERFGSPIMRSCNIIIGLLVGCIVAAACGYFDRTSIDEAPLTSFVWVKTFPLQLYPPAILPLLALYVVLMMESIGDMTATSEVSRLEVSGAGFDSRIQGGLLGDGLIGITSGLMTVTPMSTFAQNNGVISLTKCANRWAGFCCCFFLLVMGIFSKIAAAVVSIPKPVLGGMTTFLFSSVAVAGLGVTIRVPLTRRNRFILSASLAVGMGATLDPDWFSYVFTYNGDNRSLKGLSDAIVLVMESGFAVAGFLGMILNAILPDENDDGDDTILLEGQQHVNEPAIEIQLEEGAGGFVKEPQLPQ
ncbi:hypothetical protein KEM54_006379 [Ascosphaera aggregata]|nr:hypothetical protein KEM54_006379 [Ascosphaera aggregata]